MGCTDSKVSTEANSLSRLVAEFLEADGCCPRDEINAFQNLKIEDAVRKAALARDEHGEFYSHQWNLKEKYPDVPVKAERILVACANEIASCKDFDDLHELLKRELKIKNKVIGAGELYRYDTAFRIGISKGVYPKKVYLHAGTRDGAKALGIYREGKEVLEMSELPAELRRMQPYQVEDFLCIKKDVLHKFKRTD